MDISLVKTNKGIGRISDASEKSFILNNILS
jgi:hypothetical protein